MLARRSGRKLGRTISIKRMVGMLMRTDPDFKTKAITNNNKAVGIVHNSSYTPTMTEMLRVLLLGDLLETSYGRL